MDAMHSPASTENLLFWRTCARWYDRFVNRAFPEYLDIVDRIVADATPSDRLLEVATGTGNVALSLAKGCGRIDAIDYSPGMLRVAKRKASERGVRNVNFARQNVYTLDYPAALFDSVVCAHALHRGAVVRAQRLIAQANQAKATAVKTPTAMRSHRGVLVRGGSLEASRDWTASKATVPRRLCA